MRISFLLSSLQLSGGVRVVIEYANRLAKRGHLITLVAPRGTVEAEMLSALVPTVQLRESRIARTPKMSALQLLRLTWSLAAAAPQSDVIMPTHTPTTAAGWVASQLQRKGRLIWLYQDYLAMFRGRTIETWLLRNALRWHEAAFVISTFAQRELATFAPGPIFVVGEGLSHADVFQPVPFTSRSFTGEYIILTMGDTRPRKGFLDFWQAVELVYATIPNLTVWVFAKEPCAIETHIPHHYFYRPSPELLAELYGRCHLFVSASHWESFGLPPLEAMACGAPVVMTNAQGVMEYAVAEKNCLLTPPAEPTLLAAAMQRVLQNRALAQHLSENGPTTAQKFSWENAVDRFEAALQATITYRDDT